jgi:hypothetical protein
MSLYPAWSWACSRTYTASVPHHVEGTLPPSGRWSLRTTAEGSELAVHNRLVHHAPVAQLDKASAYGADDSGFESLQAHVRKVLAHSSAQRHENRLCRPETVKTSGRTR